jgi:predicted nucleic acid-binding protein
MIIVADTTPSNYLVLLQHVDLLPRLFGDVVIPVAVPEGLQDPESPESVRAWITQRPPWLHFESVRSKPDPDLSTLIGESGKRLPLPKS